MKNLIYNAKINHYAIPQFNINNLEWTRYILEECELLKSPVFLGVSPSAASYMGGYKLIRNMVNNLLEELHITIPVILHLDHGKNVEECFKAYDAGFDSIMIDASVNDLKTNIKMTNQVKEYCQNAIIEAEIGVIKTNDLKTIYTNLEEAKKFIDNTNIDLLAPSVGTMHGIYSEEPRLNYDLISSLNNYGNLVLHGGSGLTVESLRKCIEHGIIKINFNTELQVSWSRAVRKYLTENSSAYDPRKIIASGEQSLKDTVKYYIEILNSKDKG